jgi:hypothetical protein
MAAPRRFLLPVKVLSRRFRRLVLKALAKAYADGALQFFGELESLRDPSALARFLAPLEHKEWVVYAKPPFGGPAHVLEYLGRYTHRVAISNQRLLALEDGQVSFAWTDYRDSLRKVMRVPAEEFIRLFLQHALPRGLLAPSTQLRRFGLPVAVEVCFDARTANPFRHHNFSSRWETKPIKESASRCGLVHLTVYSVFAAQGRFSGPWPSGAAKPSKPF